MTLLFVDCETTGLDPQVHEIVSLSFVLTADDNKEVLGAGTFYIHPQRIDTASQEALAVNGYSFDRWRLEGTSTRAEMVTRMAEMSKGAILVGHNVKFDEAFMRAAFVAEGVQPAWSYHSIDTVALAWPLYLRRYIEGLRLDDLCKRYKCVRSSVHTAEEDVKITRRVYNGLIEDLSGHL